MPSTNFSGPVTTGLDTGAESTKTIAFVPVRQVVNLDSGDATKTVAIQPNSTVVNLGFVPTSAFTGGDSVTAMNVTFSNGDVVHGVVVASAATRYTEVAFVSGANVYDSSANMTIALSAASTTTFTGGGGRAYIEYVTVE